MIGHPAFYGGLAALGGLVLAESLFIPWYSLELTVVDAVVGSTASAWHVMSVMDVALLLLALTALGGGVAVMRRPELAPIPFAAGLAALALTLLGLIDLPGSDVTPVPGDTVTIGRRAGGFVALVAAAGITFAGFAAGTLRAEARQRRRRRRPAATRA